MPPDTGDNEAFRKFVRRVWQQDVAPLLSGERADQRRKSARVAGKAAAATGLFVDGVFGLKGKPFARFMTVVGSSFGAMLPDAWDWNWLRDRATGEQRAAVADNIRKRAAELAEDEALALFDLTPTASRTDLKQAWHDVARRWHPDRAPSAQAQPEYHLRFVAFQAAHQRLVEAYDAGHLPRQSE